MEVLCDASYATLPECKLVMGHFLRTNEKSGAVYAEVGRHLAEEKKICLKFVKTDEIPADILTKSLELKKFKVFADMILGHLLLVGILISTVVCRLSISTF